MNMMRDEWQTISLLQELKRTFSNNREQKNDLT